MTDPPNGRFPALTPKGKELYDKMGGSYKPGKTVFDSPEDFDSWDRCITRGLPVSMLPRNYNNGIRIMQSPGYVVILLEMAHEARIIPTSGRPVLDPSIKQYLGESRGRWDGNTLVVETTNFKERSAYRNANPDTLRLVERFTRTAADKIEWSVTVEDPTTWTRSWTFAVPLTVNDREPVYEYACHEGNYGLGNILSAARATERERR
jgi:hypothetical protein